MQKDYNQPPLKILVSGLAGIPGIFAYRHFTQIFPQKTWGLLPHHYTQPKSNWVIPWNYEELERLPQIFEKLSPQIVIDASGSCALKACEFDSKMAYTINVKVGVKLAELAKEHGCYLIRFSSDLVFEGRDSGNYAELDEVTPLTVYGKGMAEAEYLIQQIHPHSAILRISLPMGPSLNGHAGAIDWIENRFKRNLPATLYFDEIRTPFYIEDLNKILEYFVKHQIRGLYHLGGPRALSLFQIAQVVNRIGHYPPHLLKGCPRMEAGPIPPRAGNVSMNISKITNIIPSGYLRPWPLFEACMPSSREWHYERKVELPFSISEHLYGLNLEY